MTAVQAGYKSLQVDRILPTIGRFKRTIGSDDPKMLRGVNTMLDDLIEKGRYDDLTAIRKGTVPLSLALAQWKNGALRGAESLHLTQPIDPTYSDWIDSHEITDITRRDYRNNFRQLLRHAKKNDKLKDLPSILQSYRGHCVRHSTGKVFNYTRTTVLGFVRSQVGKFSQLYKDIGSIDPMKSKKKRRNNPQTVEQVELLTAKLPEQVAGMVWDMVTTGMGWTEYEREWEEQEDRVLIHGDKTTNRDRQVPKVYPLHQRVLAYKRFREVVREASDKKVTPYDFRRTYATWMEGAGIPRTRRRLYMGHQNQDMTDLYETVEVDTYLKEDGDRLRKWIEGQRKHPLLSRPKRKKVFHWQKVKESART